jgi:hypothetical protein
MINTTTNNGNEKGATKMKNKLGIKIQKVTSHRNGVSGEGFHLVAFTFTSAAQEGGETTSLLATVFEADKHVAVIDPTDLDSKWRGDQFEAELRAATLRHEDSLPINL